MGLLKIFCILLKNARHRNFHGLCLNVNSVIVTNLCASQEIFQVFNIDWLVQRAFRRNANDNILARIIQLVVCVSSLRMIHNFHPHIDKFLANSNMTLKFSRILINFLTSNIKPQGIADGIMQIFYQKVNLITS